MIPVAAAWEADPTFDLVERIQGELQQRATADGVSGVKVMQNHFDTLLRGLRTIYRDPALSDLEIIQRVFPDVRLVFVTRQDKLRQAISLSRAEHSKIFLKRDSKQAERPDWLNKVTPIYLRAAVDRVIERERYWRDFFDAQRVKPYTITYEELSADHSGELLKVLAYLGLEVSSTTPLGRTTTLKQADWYSEFLIKYFQAYFMLYEHLPPHAFGMLRRIKRTFVKLP